MVERIDIERALDGLMSDEVGMAFQGLGVVLAKLRWPELDARARALRALVDRAAKSHAMGSAPATEWEADKDEWEHAQVRLLEDVIEEIVVTGLGPPATIQTGAMTVHICSNVPRGGTWAQNIPQLRSDTDTFAGSTRGLALRRGPFAFATLAF